MSNEDYSRMSLNTIGCFEDFIFQAFCAKVLARSSHNLISAKLSLNIWQNPINGAVSQMVCY